MESDFKFPITMHWHDDGVTNWYEIASEIGVKSISLINTSVQHFTAISPAISLPISRRVFTSNFMAVSLDTCIINFTKHISSNFIEKSHLKISRFICQGHSEVAHPEPACKIGFHK